MYLRSSEKGNTNCEPSNSYIAPLHISSHKLIDHQDLAIAYLLMTNPLSIRIFFDHLSNNYRGIVDDYFKNLKSLDPLLNAIVVSKIKELQRKYGLEHISMDHLSEKHELEVLREYCVTLYREYRTVRRMFLESLDSKETLSSLKGRNN